MRAPSRQRRRIVRRTSLCCWRIALLLLVLINENSPWIQAVPNDNDEPPPPEPRRASDSQPTTNVSNQGNVDRTLVAPFDTDIRDDCHTLLEYCQSAIFHHVYLQCPALCTKYLQQESTKGVVADHTEETLWEGTLRTLSGTRIDADRFEGSVMVIALLPLLPGMAKYYYEMMETVHEKFHPKVEVIIIPIDVGEGIHIKPRSHHKVVILEEESSIFSHPWVKHLHAVKPRSGAASRDHEDEVIQVELPTDRLTVYLVSADGYFVERMTVPTLAVLQRQIGIYLRTMDYVEL